jgi:hypothetical protein
MVLLVFVDDVICLYLAAVRSTALSLDILRYRGASHHR